MATVTQPRIAAETSRAATARLVERRLLAVAGGAAVFAALAPIGASIVTVFLFAGPHNWFEARYFLRRLPPRWGAMRNYFSLGIAGAVALTAGFALLPFLAERGDWNYERWLHGTALWNVALVAWTASLAALRRRLSPTRSWRWLWPCAAVVAAAGWLEPRAWDIALVYAHPLVALWFLDRELRKFGPEVVSRFRRTLAVVPILALLVVGLTADAAPLDGRDLLTDRISRHAGTELFTVVSDRCPVALHVFLECIHYAVWIVLLPALTLRTAPWRLTDVPLARRSVAWRRAVGVVLCAGVAIALILWAGFLVDYPMTRDVYFTVAMLHVLAEIPFLLRLL